MKKLCVLMLVLTFLFAANSTYAASLFSGNFALTTDFLMLFDQDYQGEFSYILTSKSTFSARLGYFRHLEASSEEYQGDTRKWELGGRWRYFIADTAPNLFFIGVGFNNRPEVNTVTPLGEVGLNLCLKPLIVGVVGFAGYQWHWKNSDANKWVNGVELRAGICF